MHLIAAFVALASAQPTADVPLSAQLDQCMDSGDAARGVHPAMMDCVFAEFRLQDARLNRTYAATMRRLRPAAQARLRTLQRAWIRTRDRECQDAWEESGGGQLSDLERASCRAQATANRTRWLERHR